MAEDEYFCDLFYDLLITTKDNTYLLSYQVKLRSLITDVHFLLLSIRIYLDASFFEESEQKRHSSLDLIMFSSASLAIYR